MKIIKNNFKYALLAILSLFSVYKYISLAISNKYVTLLLYLVLLILLFIYYKKLLDRSKIKRSYQVFIVIMSFIIVLGYSYTLTSSGILFFGSIKNIFISILKVIGFYFFFKVLIYNFDVFMKKEYKKEFKIVKYFSKHPFLYSFLFLSICYSIYLICYYPAILNYDNANQIKEVMGLHTRYLDAINPISGSTLTNFNPIIHTLLLGGLFKLGYNLGNVNLGLFFYTIIQLIIVISIYSYILKYSIKKGINPLYAFISLMILGIIPLFGFYSITAVKDILYTCFLLLFILSIYDLCTKDDHTYKDYLLLLLSCLLVCLFRNNGIYIVALTIPFLFLKNKKFGSLLIGIIVIIFYLGFNNVILPSLKVSPTSVREALSVSFQQTARDVIYNGDDYSDEEIDAIKEILDYDNFKKDYDEDLADPIKNKFNKDSDTSSLIAYLKVWFRHLFINPLTYIDATINNITTYFNPFESDWKVYSKLNEKLPEAGFDYHYNSLNTGRKMLYNYEKFIEKSPFGLILNIAIITWLSILIFIMLCNKNKSYIFMIPNIISLLFCVIGPANAYFRYVYPSLLILVLFFPIIKKLCEQNK